MKCNLRLWQMFFLLLALACLKDAKAQTTKFSQMNGLQPIVSSMPEQGGTFMSDEDMNLGADNDVNFEQSSFAVAPQNRDNALPAESENAKLMPKDTLTETLQQQNKQSLGSVKLPNVSDTWVGQLATSVPQAINNKSTFKLESESVSESDNSLQSLMKDSLQQGKRSNASVFDISGVMLRMNLTQAEKAMMVRGFKRVSQKLEIPNFIKWRNEETCRNNGIVGYERLMNCVVKMAQKNNYQYVETAKYVKYSTKEEIEIKLTSNFTGNKVYRIMYRSMSGKVIGSGAKAAYLRNIKVYDFWKKVNQKYGAPDNKEEVTWGLGMNKPYMKASTGFLVLEDPMFRELDYTRMSREDQRFMNTDLYSF